MTPDILPYAILTGTSVILGMWAGIGWMRAESDKAVLEADLTDVRSWFSYASHELRTAEACMKGMAAALYDAEGRLREIERQRSETTRKGNATKAAKRKALVDARKAELDSWNADRIAA